MANVILRLDTPRSSFGSKLIAAFLSFLVGAPTAAGMIVLGVDKRLVLSLSLAFAFFAPSVLLSLLRNIRQPLPEGRKQELAEASNAKRSLEHLNRVELESVLRRVEPHLKRVLAVHRIPVEDSEDLLQDAFLALIYNWDNITDPESWIIAKLRTDSSLYWLRVNRYADNEALAPRQAIRDVSQQKPDIKINMEQKEELLVFIKRFSREIARSLNPEPQANT